MARNIFENFLRKLRVSPLGIAEHTENYSLPESSLFALNYETKMSSRTHYGGKARPPKTFDQKSAFLPFNRMIAVFTHFLSLIFALTSRIDNFLVNDINIKEIGQ